MVRLHSTTKRAICTAVPRSPGAPRHTRNTVSYTRALIRIHALLGRLYYTQALIDRVREVQSKLATPDVRVWRELDGVVVALESRSRALHARYVRERDAVVALCDRVTAKAPMASGSAGRRVG